MPEEEESDIDSPPESPTLMKNEVMTNFSHDGVKNQDSFSSRTVIVDTIICIQDLLTEGDYLKQFDNWSKFREDKQDFTKNFIKKQNLIWELASGERNYLEHLYCLKNVYYNNIPIADMEKERIFPNLDKMIELHGRLFKRMLQIHKENHGTVPTGIGSVFTDEIDTETLETFQRIYGEFSYAYSERLQSFARNLQTDPNYTEFLRYVQRKDPDYKKGFDGYLLIINQRWTKVEPLLASIKAVTFENEQELDELEKARSITSSILTGAQSNMMTIKNYDILKDLRHNFHQRHESTTSATFKEDENWLIYNLGRFDVCLLNSDFLKVKVKGKKDYEGFGVAIDSGFFILTRGPNYYNLLKLDDMEEAIVTKWEHDTSIFREVEKYPLEFYLITDRKNNMQNSIIQIQCNTTDECSRWKKIFTESLERLQMDIKSIENEFQRSEKRIKQEHANYLNILKELSDYDSSMLTVIRSRDGFLQTFFQNEFMRTIEDLSINRRSSYQEKKEVVRTSSGSSLKSNTLRLKPPISTDYSALNELHKNTSRSNSTSVELRKKSCYDGYVTDLKSNCVEIVRLIQDRRPISICRSASNVEEKHREHFRSDNKSKRNFDSVKNKLTNPVGMFRNGSREKSIRKHISASDEVQDPDNDILLGSDEKFDEATFRDRLLCIAKRINNMATNMSCDYVQMQEETIYLKEENFILKKQNEILTTFHDNVFRNITCEGCRNELATSKTVVDESGIKVNPSKSFSSIEPKNQFVEFEKFRLQKEKFDREKKEWQRQMQSEKAGVERELKNINREREELERRKEKLDNEQRLLDDDKRTLQFQLDAFNDSMNGRPPITLTSLIGQPKERSSSDKYYTQEELDRLNDVEYYNRIANVTTDDIPVTMLGSKINTNVTHSKSMAREELTAKIPTHLAKPKKSDKKNIFKKN